MSGVHVLNNVSLFANLSRAELEPLAHLLISRKYRAGESVFAQNSLGGSLYIVKSGRVAVVVSAAEEEQTIAEIGPGQVFGEFGLLDGLPRSAGVVAQTRSELLILSRPDFFMYLEQHPAVAINLVVLLSRRLRFTLQRTEDDLESLPIVARLARLLADFGDRYGRAEDGAIQLPIRLTQGELAGMLGCPRVQTEEALNQLHERGLVTMYGLQMTIHDFAGLRAAGMAQAAPDNAA